MPAGSKVHGGVLPPPLQPLNPGRVPEGDPPGKTPTQPSSSGVLRGLFAFPPGPPRVQYVPRGERQFLVPGTPSRAPTTGGLPREMGAPAWRFAYRGGVLSPLGALPMVNTSPLPKRKNSGSR